MARKGLGRAYKIGGLPPLAPKASASELPRFWYGGVPTPPLTQEPTGLFVLPLLPPPGRLELRHASGVCPGWGGGGGGIWGGLPARGLSPLTHPLGGLPVVHVTGWLGVCPMAVCSLPLPLPSPGGGGVSDVAFSDGDTFVTPPTHTKYFKKI